MRPSGRVRRVVRRSFHPAVLGASLLYAGVLYVAGLSAGVLDIEAPFWVAAVAAVLLFSPLYHGFVIPWLAADGRRPRALGAAVLANFPRLFVGQLLLGAGVVLGLVALILPGVYLGIRGVLYKQAIVLEGATPVDALRSSFRETADGRTVGLAAAALGVFYGVAVGSDLLAGSLDSPIARGVLSVAVSGCLLAVVNALLTDLHARHPADPPMESAGGSE